MNPKTTISVIICTYNRCESVKDTLESFLKINIPKSFDFEILIIDNNSSDQTRVVTESLMPQFAGKLRYLFEGHQGKSYALNCGIKEAKGDILAFTDDDVLVDVDYLREIMNVFDECADGIGFIGGKISPVWNGEKPEWVYGSLLGALAMLDYGDKSFVLDSSMGLLKIKSNIFFGANLAVRKEIFVKYGGFNINKIVAEDTEMCLRLYANGIKGRYAPTVVVRHKVPPARTCPKYFYRWYFQQGQYQEIVENPAPGFFQPFGIPVWFLKQTMQYFFKSVFAINRHQRIVCRCWALFNCGQMIKIIRGMSQGKCPKSL